MKTSIKLLLGLILLIVAGLFYVKYDLHSQYEALDTSDPYFGFEKTEDLAFSHIKIEGGNKSHLFIEPAATNRLLIESSIKADISYAVVSDTLIITYSEVQTQAANSGNNYWGTRERSSVIIEYVAVQSIMTIDASVGMQMSGQKQFKTELYGMSNLELFTSRASLQSLSIEAHNESKHRVNCEEGIDNLAFLNMTLTDQSMAELYRISADSSYMQLDSTSRISADANFFKN